MSHPPAAPPAVPEATNEKLFTPNFVLACVTSLAAFSSFYLLLATLPVYIMKIGGSESEVGLIIGIFSATAIVVRLLVGKSADSRGTKLFIVAGAGLMTICSGAYILARGVVTLLILRAVHGAAWASFGTSNNALVAGIVPAKRRGEAMGYYGMFSNLAMAVGPAVGVMLMTGSSFDLLFTVSAAAALLAVALSWPIKEPRAAHRPPTTQAKGPNQGVIERTALFPSVILAMMAMTYASLVSFLPIYAGKQGIANPGFFFTAYAITLLLARSFTGQLSDRYGRAAVIMPGVLLCAASLAILPMGASLGVFLASAVLYGLGFAAFQPAMMALVVDRVAPSRRGAAMGTFSTAMDLGIGSGSVIWGVVAQTSSYETMYFAASLVALVALAVFVAGGRKLSPRPAETNPR